VRDNTPQKLLQATIALLQERPDFSVRDITARAGVGTGAVNYHYRTRDDLVQQAVQAELERFLAEWPERWGGLGESPAGRPRTALLTFTDFLTQSPHLAVIWLQQSLQPGRARRDDDPMLQLEALLLHLLRPLCAAATEDVLRMRAWLLANGIAVQFLRGVRREWYDRSAEWSRFVDQLLAAVEATGS